MSVLEDIYMVDNAVCCCGCSPTVLPLVTSYCCPVFADAFVCGYSAATYYVLLL